MYFRSKKNKKVDRALNSAVNYALSSILIGILYSPCSYSAIGSMTIDSMTCDEGIFNFTLVKNDVIKNVSVEGPLVNASNQLYSKIDVTVSKGTNLDGSSASILRSFNYELTNLDLGKFVEPSYPYLNLLWYKFFTSNNSGGIVPAGSSGENTEILTNQTKPGTGESVWSLYSLYFEDGSFSNPLIDSEISTYIGETYETDLTNSLKFNVWKNVQHVSKFTISPTQQISITGNATFFDYWRYLRYELWDAKNNKFIEILSHDTARGILAATQAFGKLNIGSAVLFFLGSSPFIKNHNLNVKFKVIRSNKILYGQKFLIKVIGNGADWEINSIILMK